MSEKNQITRFVMVMTRTSITVNPVDAPNEKTDKLEFTALGLEFWLRKEKGVSRRGRDASLMNVALQMCVACNVPANTLKRAYDKPKRRLSKKERAVREASNELPLFKQSKKAVKDEDR